MYLQITLLVAFVSCVYARSLHKNTVWVNVGTPASNEKIEFVIGINHHVDHSDFVARHTPGSDSFHDGKFMSHYDARKLAMKNVDACIETLKTKFFDPNGMNYENTTRYQEYWKVESDVSTLEGLLNRTFHIYRLGANGLNVSRIETNTTNPYDLLPESIRSCVGHVGRLWDFPFVGKSKPRIGTASSKSFKKSNQAHLLQGAVSSSSQVTPDTLWSMYSIPDASGVTPPASLTQGVFEYTQSTDAQGQTEQMVYSPSDLNQYQSNYGIKQNSFTLINGGEGTCNIDGSNCGEPNLDTQMLTAANRMNTPTAQNIFFYVQDTSELLQQMASESAGSLTVISISYGSNENFEARSQCNEFKSLADQGVSVFVSSGDGGASDNTCEGFGLNCGYEPSQPADCPYVTAVGATNGFSAGSEIAAMETESTCIITSGGGFSTIFTTDNGYDLSWQSSQTNVFTSTYFTQSVGGVSSQPNPYATTGRGLPDVSAVGCNIVVVLGGQEVLVSGTSASAPIWAGIIAQIAMANGVKGFGWINPTLYQNPDIFYDVTQGNNICGEEGNCDDTTSPAYGYFTAPGWDPVTGLGTLGKAGAYSSLEAALVGSSTRPTVPHSTVSPATPSGSNHVLASTWLLMMCCFIFNI